MHTLPHQPHLYLILPNLFKLINRVTLVSFRKLALNTFFEISLPTNNFVSKLKSVRWLRRQIPKHRTKYKQHNNLDHCKWNKIICEMLKWHFCAAKQFKFSFLFCLILSKYLLNVALTTWLVHLLINFGHVPKYSCRYMGNLWT